MQFTLPHKANRALDRMGERHKRQRESKGVSTFQQKGLEGESCPLVGGNDRGRSRRGSAQSPLGPVGLEIHIDIQVEVSSWPLDGAKS